MKYLNIPQTDLKAAQICLGTGGYDTDAIPSDLAASLLDAYVERGGNFIDTAHVYSDWIPGTKSISEKFVGRWLKEHGNRDQLIVATKGAHPLLSSMNVSRMSPADIATDVNESLEYLQVDTIDLYWLHRDDTARPVSEIIESLNEHISAGRIRYIGASNWRIGRIREANAYAQAHGLQGFVAHQPMWSLAVPNIANWPDQTITAMDDEGIAFHRETGMAAIPFSSQARGFFTKMAEGKAVRANDERLYHNATNSRRLEQAKALAAKYGRNVTEIVLAYMLAQPFPTFPIIGCRTLDQLDESLRAADVQLTEADVQFLEQ